MKFCLMIIFLCTAFFAIAQSEIDYAQIDRVIMSIPSSQTNNTADIAAYIKSHFDTEGKRVRAAYTWVANNIKYSTDSLHRVILNEDREQEVSFAFRRRKGVCENFAAIFNDICAKSGLQSYLIDGYTRLNRSTDKTGHAWNAVYVNNKWYLYDPTWDAGFETNSQLINHTATQYFQQTPQEFIQSHMPFDPLFQFLDYPVTYQEFNKGSAQENKDRGYFNYMDSIALYRKQDSLSRYVAASSRIRKNGNASSMVALKLSQLKMESEIVYQDEDAGLYNSAVEDYTAAVINFKSFLEYRNNRFMPLKSEAEITAMLDAIELKIAAANTKLKIVNTSKATLTLNTGDVEKMLDDLLTHVKEQQIFLKNYLGTTK